MELSVILISKNQAWNMERLIESVLQNTADISPKEIVLVDSASTDDTTEVAAEYPISVLRLQPTQHLTPSAGRYIGYKHTTGKFILFLDGDMELVEGWLERALQILKDESKIALVTGEIVDLPIDAKNSNKPPLILKVPTKTTEILNSGGAALYRRSVLEEVGTFNPYLYSDEEPELCIRVRFGGYQIIHLEYPIAYHYTAVRDKLSSLYGRWKRRLYLGAGQSIRYHLNSEMLWAYINERGFGLIPVLGLGLGLIALLWAVVFGKLFFLYIWLLSVSVMFIGDAYRKQSFYQALSSFLKRIFIADGTVRGFLLKPLDVNKYPDQFEQIK